jgi:type II secretory pathway pseudopilin PulG
MPQKKNHTSESAFTLLEAMVAIAVISISAVSITQFFANQYRQTVKEKLRLTQRSIAASLLNGLSSPTQVFYSATRSAVNPTFSYCILGIPNPDGSSACTAALNPAKPISFALFQTSNQSGTSGVQISSGETPNSVLYYDDEGNICTTPGEDNCVFTAETFFYVACPQNDPSCSRGIAQAFFTYRVKQEFNFGKQKVASLSALPQVPTVIPLTGLQIVGPDRYSKCDVTSDTNLQDAPTDEARYREKIGREVKGKFASIVGYDQSGRPICECKYPFVKLDPKDESNNPSCRLLTEDELTCQSGYLRNYDKASGKSTCINQKEAFSCRSISATERCGKNEWMTAGGRNSCVFSCIYYPKPHPEDVKPREFKITCAFSWNSDSNIAKNLGDQDYTYPDFSCPDDGEFLCCFHSGGR